MACFYSAALAGNYSAVDRNGLLSVFHLKNHHTKNLKGMTAALRLLEEEGDPSRLAIVGGGTDASVAECKSLAAGLNSISFEGPLDREALRQRMNRATGFVMPSLRESFGLVFIEALFAGLPIIYPADAAVDGYFDDAPFALRVDAGDRNAIADAMRVLSRDEARLKDELEKWQSSADAARFTRRSIARIFAGGLGRAIASHRPVQ